MPSLSELENQSRETTTNGALNNRSVVFHYAALSADDASTSRLSWNFINTDSGEEEGDDNGGIDRSDIIAVLDLNSPDIPVNGHASLVRHDSETENDLVSSYKILALQRVNQPAEDTTVQDTEIGDSDAGSNKSTDPKIETPPRLTFRSFIARNLPSEFLEDFSPLRQRPSYLTIPSNADKSPNLHIIVSILSGTRLAHGFFEDIVQPTLSNLGITPDQYIVHETESAHTVTDLTRSIFLPRAQDGVQQTIILLSGDGGVVDAVNGLLSSKRSDHYVQPLIGLLALGTGNALAHSMNIVNDSTLGLSNLLKGAPRALPLFLARFSPGSVLLVDEGRSTENLHITDEQGSGAIYGAVVCSWGFHAALVADSDTVEYRKFGAKRFQMAGKEALYPSDGSPPHAYKARVSLIKRAQGNPYSYNYELVARDSHSYILATLVSNLEKGFTISPESRPLDGRLRVIHFGHMSGDDIMGLMTLAYQGGLHVQEPTVSYEEVEGLRIDFANGFETDARWRRICVDGKIVRVPEYGWTEVRNVDGGVVDVVYA
ncbi:hypothetical protein L228DRAFT_248944 [Xylona heveae TC161]|uniref:DAGKc domain-containing protein n=1 Tax=Xylona heveae (strain CBS 132557 / TC161) TaxID=1328760 RepID=A0A165FMX4_XYLHT|nr:hypothetical protein L228DRAFT_248944 [Xylona heveae TC161]KZF21172.1 hypothetical protein L228DRAFT_248944 [Xylona heveae TC161]